MKPESNIVGNCMGWTEKPQKPIGIVEEVRAESCGGLLVELNFELGNFLNTKTLEKSEVGEVEHHVKTARRSTEAVKKKGISLCRFK